MNTLFRSIFFAGALLLFCKIGADVQIVNDHHVTWQDSASCPEPAGEEDSKEFGNDDLAGHAEAALLPAPRAHRFVYSGPFDFSEHIQEVVPPPPLS